MPPEQWAKQIQDAIASSTKVREGLSDDDALPLMDWGIAYANALAARLSAPDAPEPTGEQVGNTAYSLTRLMTRITWLVTYRTKKDARWLTQTFQMVNKLSQELLGSDAPVFSDEEIAAWIADHPNHTDGDLIRNLMARLSPPTAAVPPPEPPALGLLSDSVFGSLPAAPDRPEQPQPGDEYD
jgi:hypothetical protein